MSMNDDTIVIRIVIVLAYNSETTLANYCIVDLTFQTGLNCFIVFMFFVIINIVVSIVHCNL